MSQAFTAEVHITPREGILDPEGETIARALANLGYRAVSEVRAGRLIRLSLQAESPKTAKASVEEMCEELIANPLIEEYTVVVEPARNESSAEVSSEVTTQVEG